MVGAWFSSELIGAIDAWRAAHPGASQSMFLILAVIEKLEREGIEVNKESALHDRRTRLPQKEQAAKNIAYLISARKRKKQP